MKYHTYILKTMQQSVPDFICHVSNDIPNIISDIYGLLEIDELKILPYDIIQHIYRQIFLSVPKNTYDALIIMRLMNRCCCIHHMYKLFDQDYALGNEDMIFSVVENNLDMFMSMLNEYSIIYNGCRELKIRSQHTGFLVKYIHRKLRLNLSFTILNFSIQKIVINDFVYKAIQNDSALIEYIPLLRYANYSSLITFIMINFDTCNIVEYLINRLCEMYPQNEHNGKLICAEHFMNDLMKYYGLEKVQRKISLTQKFLNEYIHAYIDQLSDKQLISLLESHPLIENPNKIMMKRIIKLIIDYPDECLNFRESYFKYFCDLDELKFYIRDLINTNNNTVFRSAFTSMLTSTGCVNNKSLMRTLQDSSIHLFGKNKKK